MTRAHSCDSAWRSPLVPLKLLMLILCFIQPCHAAGQQGVTLAGDPLSSNESKPVNALALNLPTMELRPAADRNGSGANGTVQVQSPMPVKKAHPPGVNWNGVLVQSAFFLGIQQGFRLVTEPGTREALKGPFFDDWFQAVKSTHGWGDGDNFLTNYIGHPLMGGGVSNIFVQNDSRGRATTFGKNPAYWSSRFKGMLYSAVYDAQFELGPISEASIGNVGHLGESQSGAVDLVVTPLAGLGWQVGEDILDKYLVMKIEAWIRNPGVLMFARSILNPSRAFANMMAFRVPWHRNTRPGVFGRGRDYYDQQPVTGSRSSSAGRTK